MAQKIFNSEANAYQSVNEFLQELAHQYNLSGEALHHLELVSEEIVVNICKHGYPNKTGEIVVSCDQDEKGGLCITFCDQGKSFNPLSFPAPDLTSGIADRPIGGLGIHLVCSLTKKQSYERQGDKNIFKVWL